MSKRPESRQPREGGPLTTEDLRLRIGAAERAEATQREQASAEPAREPEPVRPRRAAVKQRLAMRLNETFEQEVARYPARLAKWEEKRAAAASRKGSEAEDLAHLLACAERGCGHPAHVRARREWRENTKEDVRHLLCCESEEDDVLWPGPGAKVQPGCLDDAHLLPPRPIEPAEEFCCRRGCAERGTRRAWLECVSVDSQVRRRREAEFRRNPKAFTFLPGRVEGDLVLAVNYAPVASEGTLALWRTRVYDSALDPVRED
jgi:hypothetical protein